MSVPTDENLPLPPRDCVLFSTADWRWPYWTNKQHTAQVMAARGWRVLYVESLGFRSPRANSGRDWWRLTQRALAGVMALVSGPRQVAPNLWVLAPPVIPGARRWPARRLNKAVLDWILRRFMRTTRFERPVLWTYHPYMLDLPALSACDLLVYHCVDDLAAFPGVDARALRVAETELARRADVIFATAPALADRLGKVNSRTMFLPNVVDEIHFARAMSPGPLPSELAALPEPRLGYHGVLSDFKLDLALLTRVAYAHPEWHFVFIGDEREGQRSPALAELRGFSNVHMLGHRPYAVLPEYLRGIAVGLLPTARNSYTESMFPMKFYEYLAAGVPVVSTPVAFAEGGYVGLEIGEDAASFAAAVDRQLARGRLTPAEAAAAVGDNTWQHRMDKMEAAMAAIEVERARNGDA